MVKKVPDPYIPRGISAEQQASIYAEGNQAFLEGIRRRTNSYAGMNTALAAIGGTVGIQGRRNARIS